MRTTSVKIILKNILISFITSSIAMVSFISADATGYVLAKILLIFIGIVMILTPALISLIDNK